MRFVSNYWWHACLAITACGLLVACEKTPQKTVETIPVPSVSAKITPDPTSQSATATPIAIVTNPIPSPKSERSTNAKAIEIRDRAINEFAKNGQVAPARRLLLDALKLDSKDTLTLYQLGLLAEKERKWPEALIWFEYLLNLENKSALAKKITLEIANLKWAIAYDNTPAGRRVKESRIYEEMARKSVEAGNWSEASTNARKVLQADSSNIDAGLILVASETKQQHYMFAELVLQTMSQSAPANRKTELSGALNKLRHERDFAEKRASADALFAHKKRSEAGEAYAALWRENPEHYDLFVSALQGYVLGENYTEAKALVVELKTQARPKDSLPTGLQDLDGLTIQLNRLSSLAGRGTRSAKLTKTSSKVSRKTSSKSSSAKPQSMANDFLSRIKK